MYFYSAKPWILILVKWAPLEFFKYRPNGRRNCRSIYSFRFLFLSFRVNVYFWMQTHRCADRDESMKTWSRFYCRWRSSLHRAAILSFPNWIDRWIDKGIFHDIFQCLLATLFLHSPRATRIFIVIPTFLKFANFSNALECKLTHSGQYIWA